MRQKRRKIRAAAERAAMWEKIILEARAFPAGVGEYLRQRNISKNTYYFHFKRLRQEHPEWHDLPNNNGADHRNSNDDMTETPETEVVEKALRRKFSAQFKAEILRQLDGASEGQGAAILRREGLYSSHIAKWRRELASTALVPQKRGPAANPLTSENQRLKQENARLQKKLKQAEDIIDVQKKIAEILGLTPTQPNDDE